MPNPTYFSQYASPNIVIVPTVSFCGPPNKKPRLDAPAPIQVQPENTSCEDISEPCIEINSTSVQVQDPQCSNSNNESVSFQKDQCYTPSNTSSEDDLVNKCNVDVIMEDVNTSFSKADCDKMVKKTLSWASNYLKSIGQSHPNASKQHQATATQLQKKDDGRIKIQLKDNPSLRTPEVLFTSSNHNPLAQNSRINDVVNKPTLNIEPLKTKKLREPDNNTKNRIPINLLSDKTTNNSDYSKSRSYKSYKEAKSLADDEVCQGKHHRHNTIKSTKPTNTKYLTSVPPAHITLQKCKYSSNEYIQKNKTDIRNTNKISSQSSPNTKIPVKRSNPKDDKNIKRKCNVTKETKFKRIQESTSKVYSDTKKSSFSSSKHVPKNNTKCTKRLPAKCSEKYLKTPVRDLNKYISKADDKNNINIKKQIADKTNLLQNSNENDIKPKEGKCPTPIKSVVQITEKFDLKVPSLQNVSIKEDLRNKLKRKHQTYQESKRDNLIITVQNCKKDIDHTGNKDDANKKLSIECTPPILTQEARKYKKIEIVIKLVCENSPESSESDNDSKSNQCPLANVDLSFLDDFNVDDIVESLYPPDAKSQVYLNAQESVKIKEEFKTKTKTSSSDTLADNNNNQNEATQIRLFKGTDRLQNDILAKHDQSTSNEDNNVNIEKNIKHCLDEYPKNTNQFNKAEVALKKNVQHDSVELADTKVIQNYVKQESNINDETKTILVNNDILMSDENDMKENKLNIHSNKVVEKDRKMYLNAHNSIDLDGECHDINEMQRYTDKNISDIGRRDLITKEENNTIIIISDSENEESSSTKVHVLKCNNIKNNIDVTEVNSGTMLIDVIDLDKKDVNPDSQNTDKLESINSTDLKGEQFILGPNTNHESRVLVQLETIKNEESGTSTTVHSISTSTAESECGSQSRMSLNKDEHIIPDENINIKEEIGAIQTKDNGESNVKNANFILETKEKNHDTEKKEAKKCTDKNNLNSFMNSEIKLKQEDKILPENNATIKNISKLTNKVPLLGNTPESNLASPYIKAQLPILHKRMLAYFGEQINITRLIHNGKFSNVFVCKNLQGRMYALKVTHLKMTKGNKEKETMLKLLQKDIPKKNFHCIRLIDGFATKDNWCFLMEYYPKNLQTALENNGKGFHIDLVQKLSRQLISALVLLRNNNILHLGIKPEHILLSSCNDRLKLTGFDEAQYLNNAKVLPNIGKINYRPPEVILGYTNIVKVDVWAAALILYEMSTKQKLFPGHYNNDILFKQQSMFGNIPFDFLEQSRFTWKHYFRANFTRVINKNVKVTICDFANNSNMLNMQIFEAYNREWSKSRTRKQRTQDKQKLGLFVNLLQEMLILHPRDRLPIEFAYTNHFIYETYDALM